MSDVHAEHAPEAPMDPTDPWGTLGAHVVAAKGARGARVGGGNCSSDADGVSSPCGISSFKATNSYYASVSNTHLTLPTKA